MKLEKPVQEPAEIAGREIDGVTAAEEPEPAAVLVLDAGESLERQAVCRMTVSR